MRSSRPVSKDRISVETIASTSSNIKPRCTLTLCVVGISGPDSTKGVTGSGKSVLCNRLVRPHFIDFHSEHINCLSQADFSCSNVVNAEHWLYWGEAELDASDYAGKTTHVRVLEQTVFLDDERFEPLGNGRRSVDDYVKRALKTAWESPGKSMYICRDQLGQESDFICHMLPNGRTSIEAFCVVFDVSRVEGRSFEKQFNVVSSLLFGALKTKKHIFLVATKCDHADAEGLQDFHRLVQKKEIKSALGSQIHVVEVSALENVNVVELLYLVASVADKQKHKQKVLSFGEAQRHNRERVASIRAEFQHLLEQALPREEYLLQKNRVTWPILLADHGVSCHAAYYRFVAEFGPRAARLAFEEHQRACKEWWLDHELAVRMPTLRNVLLRLFDRSMLCQTKWDQLVLAVEQHPQFDAYFQPLGRSVERLTAIDEQWDERLPSELLEKAESRFLFHELQKELLNEIALERQAEKFRQLLAAKKAVVTPGRPFKDARVLVDEIAAFEQALPPECALRIYDAFQEELRLKARRNLLELLLENIELFVDLVVEWRIRFADLPMIGLGERENAFVHGVLREDKRYRHMGNLVEDRQSAIGQFVSFVSLPLERHCPAGSLCADLLAAIVLESQINSSGDPFCSIDLIVHGDEPFADGFINAVQRLTRPMDRLFDHNGCLVRFSSVRSAAHTDSSKAGSSCRVPSHIFLLTSHSDASRLFDSPELAQFGTSPRLSPVFVQIVPEPSDNRLSITQMGRKLADHFNGVFIAFNQSQGPNYFSHESRQPLTLVDELRERFASTNSSNESQIHFREDHLSSVLTEVCAIQLESGFADLRIRVSILCGDPFPVESILLPLLEQSQGTSRTDSSGRKFTLDVHLPEDRRNIRVSVAVGSYHNWLLSKWPLNSFQGHVLVYSASRRASWEHAKCAARLLIDSVDQNGGADGERLAMGRSILLVAVNEPNAYFTSNDVNRYLRKGAKLAEEIGCDFVNMSPSRNASTTQMRTYLDFFQKVLHNPLLPADYYTISSRGILPLPDDDTSFISQQQYLQRHNRTSTLTGSASTLLSGYSTGSARSNDDDPGAAAMATGGGGGTTNNQKGCGNCAALRRKSYQSKRALAGSPTSRLAASDQQRHDCVTAADSDDDNSDVTARTTSTALANAVATDRPSLETEQFGAVVLERQRDSPPPINHRQSPRSSGVFPLLFPLRKRSSNTNMNNRPRSAILSVANSGEQLMVPPNNFDCCSNTGGPDDATNIFIDDADSLGGGGSLGQDPFSSRDFDGHANAAPSSSKPQRRLDKIISSFIQLRTSSSPSGDNTSPISTPTPRRQRMGQLQRRNSIDKTPSSAASSTPSPRRQATISGSTSTSSPSPISDSNSHSFRHQKHSPNAFLGRVLAECPGTPASVTTNSPRLAHSQRSTTSSRIPQMVVRRPALERTRLADSIMSRSMDSLMLSGGTNAVNPNPDPVIEESKTNGIRKPRPEASSRRTPPKRSRSVVRWPFNAAKVEDTNIRQNLTPPSNLARRVFSTSWRRKKVEEAQGFIAAPSDLMSMSVIEFGSVSPPPPPDTKSSSIGGPFSWLPSRSPRQFRAKSESVRSDKNNGLSPTSTTSSTASKNASSQSDSLERLCQSANGLPLFLTKCVEFIEGNGGIEVEGLYRVPGNQSQVSELEKAFKKSERVDLAKMNIPVHAVATALKKFLDVLPQPLIPESAHQPILQSFAALSPSQSTQPREETELLGLKFAVEEHLPDSNQRVLAYLIRHLRKVAEHAETNAMDLRNLSKVWGPTIFRPNFDSFEMMASSMNRFELAMLLLLQHCDSIFRL